MLVSDLIKNKFYSEFISVSEEYKFVINFRYLPLLAQGLNYVNPNQLNFNYNTIIRITIQCIDLLNNSDQLINIPPPSVNNPNDYLFDYIIDYLDFMEKYTLPNEGLNLLKQQLINRKRVSSK